jgi:hypothetical protein
MRHQKAFAVVLLLCGTLSFSGCAEININVREGATATITIEQDRTQVTTDTEIPLGTAVQ